MQKIVTSVSFNGLNVWSKVCLLNVSYPDAIIKIDRFPFTSRSWSKVSSVASNKFASLKSGKYNDATSCATAFLSCVKSETMLVFKSNVLKATQSFWFK